MSVFRTYLENTYAKDPTKISRFASDAFVLIRIRQRYWKGYKKVGKADVTADNVAVDEETVTRPSWKLCPKEVLNLFQAKSDGIRTLVATYCFHPKKENGDDEDLDGADAETGTILVGGGRYAVDAAHWPRLQRMLAVAKDDWAAAADEWTTEDGYQKFHDLLKAERGDSVYSHIKELVPDRHTLRSRYGLFYRKAPVRIVEDTTGDPVGEEGRKGELVDLLDLAVRPPRLAAAGVWRELAEKLITPDGQALIPVRTNAKGETVTTTRGLKPQSVNACREETEALIRSDRYLDDTLIDLRNVVAKEIPDAPDALKAYTKTLNSDDAAAVRLGTLLVKAAAAAADEAGMCEGLRRALSRQQ